jgi:hypothetical protein
MITEISRTRHSIFRISQCSECSFLCVYSVDVQLLRCDWSEPCHTVVAILSAWSLSLPTVFAYLLHFYSHKSNRHTNTLQTPPYLYFLLYNSCFDCEGQQHLVTCANETCVYTVSKIFLKVWKCIKVYVI